MKLEQLEALFRVETTDTVAPYLWSSDDVRSWLNEAEAEAAIRGRLLFADDNDDLCVLTIESGTAQYDMAKSVVEVTAADITDVYGIKTDLRVVTRSWLDKQVPGWRILGQDRPVYLVQDESSAQFVPVPDAAYSARMDVYHVPVDEMTDGSDEPGIAAHHHRHLIRWAMFRAYGIPDADTKDDGKAKQAYAEFEAYFGPRPDSSIRRQQNAERPRARVSWC